MSNYVDPLEEPGAVRNILGFHPATEETAPKHAAIREAAIDFADYLINSLPKSRERTEAFNRVREAMMYANAAIAVHGDAPVAEDASKPHAYYQSEKYRAEHTTGNE